MAAAPDSLVPSRRSLLRAGLAGLAGLALGALGRPRAAEAAAYPLIIGAANEGGASNTSLTTSSTGTAFQVNQNGSGTALRGVAGNGIAGFFTSANGSGVSGVVANKNNYGVYGGNDAASKGIGAAMRANGKSNDGLVATTDGMMSYAIKAVHNANGTAVQADTGDGTAVIGTADAVNGWGVIGQSTAATGTGNGVYGATSSPSGHGVYSWGDAHVTLDLSVSGNLTKGSGSFKIDHPLDPANKFLYHSFVESPDMKNVYDGVVRLDAKGEAILELPDWFEALNRDFRYQLTPIGAGAPDLHVKAEVEDGRFSIGGGLAGQRVCWQVTGIRKDAFAEAHRIPVEELKPEAQRGLYLHPVEHGKSKDTGIDAAFHARHVAPRLARDR